MDSSEAMINGTQDDARRHTGLQGSPNFRDAGGYRCDEGTVAWGRVFRSGHLATLTEADRERLTDLDLAMVVDLRRADERQMEPSWLPEGVVVIGADITPGSQDSVIYADSTQLGGAQAMFDFMCDINREFVDSQTDTYKDVFSQVLGADVERVLFHCSAGKDRTGFAIAVLQMALGVSLADIETDYLLSRRYYLPEAQTPRVRSKYPVDHLSDAELRPMMQAELDYLHSALAAMKHSYGSSEAYLEDGLGLGEQERRELRRRFVITD
ncbi:tyrosine-protein phosphatase [Congregibacter brevis]|uniref:Tyrosine-protein phosphatase n=1 Tax=Congregibacter brevis TaxID=3081201 RepID=A0ABZ0IEG7_9GAMM|nr:tyrosine-protein phosphatase [Congregibacter sp. IMCC45268]